MKQFYSILLLAILMLSACGGDSPKDDPRLSGIKFLDKPVTRQLHPNYQRILENHRSRYRLKPDFRLKMALEDVYRFFGVEESHISVRYKNNGWVVYNGKRDVGSLPLLPSFSDLKKLLSSVTADLLKSNPISLQSTNSLTSLEKQIERFYIEDILSALKKLNDAYNKKQYSAALFAFSTRAMSYLCIQQLDDAQQSDSLYAKSLAMLVLSETLTQNKFTLEEGLIAYSMGYREHSGEIAATLGVDHPFTQLYRNQAPSTDRTSKLKPFGFASYVDLQLAANHHQVRDWERLHKRHFSRRPFSLSQFKVALTLPKMNIQRLFAEVLSPASISSFALVFNVPAVKDYRVAITPNRVKTFAPGAALSALKKGCYEIQAEGWLLNRRLISNLYSGFIFSSLYRQGRFYLYSLASVPAASEFLNGLGESDDQRLSHFKSYYSWLIRIPSRRIKVNRVLQDLSGLSSIGGVAFWDLYDTLRKYSAYHRGGAVQATRILFSKSDTRPLFRERTGKVAFDTLFDVKLAKVLLKKEKKMNDPFRYIDRSLLYFRLNGDTGFLRKIAQTLSAPLGVKLDALFQLKEMSGKSDPSIEDGFERVIAENPHNFSIVYTFTDYLNKYKKFGKVKTVLEKWIRNNKSRNNLGFDMVNAKKELAKALLHLNKLDRAIATVENAVSSYQAGALETKARILAKMGKLSEAIQWGEAAAKRYPQVVRTRAILASLYWANGEHMEAAMALKAVSARFQTWDWAKLIAPYFYEVFSKQPVSESVKAMDMLVATKLLPKDLATIGTFFFEMGKPDMAHTINERIQAPGFQRLYITLDSYKFLKAWKGEQEAVRWVNSQFNAMTLRPVPAIAFATEKYDLLWNMDFSLLKNQDVITLWLMRAAAYLKAKESDPDRWESIKKFFNHNVDFYYYTVGEFFTGKINETSVRSLIVNEKRKCEIAYFIGLFYEIKGDYNKASEWFRICVETGQARNLEFGWAKNTLIKWVNDGEIVKGIQ